MARHIARVAARLFATQGYDATSVREIVEGAGVAKPTLYYYFRSKEGLAKALVSVPLSNLVEQLRQIVTTEKDPVHCLEQILEAHFAFCREDPDRSRFLYALIFGPPGSETAIDLEWLQGRPGPLDRGGGPPAGRGGNHPPRPGRCLHHDVPRADRDHDPRFPLRRQTPGQDLARVLVSDLLQGFDERRSAQGPEPRP